MERGVYGGKDLRKKVSFEFRVEKSRSDGQWQCDDGTDELRQFD